MKCLIYKNIRREMLKKHIKKLMKFLKSLGKKVIFWVIMCIIFLAILLLQCFVFSKDDYNPKEDTTTNYMKSSSNSTGKGVVNGVTGFVNEAYDSYKNTDVTGKDYNTFNFDDRLLLYEGENEKSGVNAVLEILILDADDDFYSKPSITLENFGNNNSEVIFSNSEEYKSALEEVKNNLEDEAKYNISFGYTALNAVANEVIITKK
jgi:hypothetical protein